MQKPALSQLLHDLQAKCRVKDYPGVQLEQLNDHVEKFGPLEKPVFGEQQAFFIDEGRLIPYRLTNYGDAIVAEIDKLSGPGSQLTALDHKMRNEYFQHGVELGWLIDPRPDCHTMYEYYLDKDNQVQCSDNSGWRDLDGGDVLPGFTLESVALDMVLNQDSGSSSEEEVDLTCPERGCRQDFSSRGKFVAHVDWHRDENARQRYRAKQNL